MQKIFFALFLFALAKLHSEQLQFYAHKAPVADHFNEPCILCTEPEEYEATIAFTKHWKITYWANQAYLGRSLIVSKRHFGSYEEMRDEEANEYREILRTYLPALQRAFGSTHFNVAYLMNQAYREETPNPHFHWHIIPRYDGNRFFAEESFEDPDFGNSFNFDRKHYLTGDFQKRAIDAIRAELQVIMIDKKAPED